MNLRQHIMKGGLFLAARQMLGMLIGIVGVLTLTRLIGPANYGRYAAAIGIFTFLQAIASLGVNVFLIRRAPGENDAYFHQAFTILLLSGVLTSVLAGIGIDVIEALTQLEGISHEARWMLLLLPIAMSAQVPLAKLERDLRFRTVASIELTGQVSYYASALPLAASGHLASAPFIGWATQQLVMASAQYGTSKYLPRLTWQRQRAAEILDYGISYSFSIWVWQLRTLVNPLIVGRYAGLEAVGIVALAIRLTEYLAFVKAAAWRLSLAAIGRMQEDLQRISRAINEGMLLQILALGPILGIASWIGPTVIPELFGAEWAKAMTLFPLIAVAYLFNAAFSLHSSALYALRFNSDVTSFHLLHILLFAASAPLLIRQYGVLGYGLAEMVALASYGTIHKKVKSRLGSLELTVSFQWLLAFALVLFPGYLGIFSVAGLALAMTSTRAREALVSVFRQTTEALRAR